jgi:hypothetical protein
MTTAVEVAERALKRILVQADDAPLDASDYADFWDSMNAFMDSLEGENIVLGYTPVSDAADVITIPDSCIRGLIANMAVEVSPDYGVAPTPALMQQARDGLRVMRKIGRPRIETSYPAGLPRGGGQEGYTYQDNPLYGPMVMLKGHIFETAATKFLGVPGSSQLAGFWKADLAQGLKLDVPGRVTRLGDGKANLTAQISLRVIGDGDYFVLLVRNGDTTEASSSVTLTSSPSTVSLSAQISDFEPGEYLEIQVINVTTANDVTALSGQIEVS